MTATSPATAVPGPYADTRVVGRRVVQYLVDTALLGVLTGLCSLLYLFGPRNPDGTVKGFAGFLVALAAVLAAIAIWLWYWVLRPYGHGGQTFGMQWLGLRVIDARGGPCGRSQLFVRTVFLIVDDLAVGLVGLITMSATRDHQRVGDLAARTLVVRT